MKKLLSIVMFSIITCTSTVLYVMQNNNTTNSNGIGINSDKLLQEIKNFSQTVKLDGPRNTLKERVTEALNNLLGNILTELTGVSDLKTITPAKEQILEKTLPQATDLLISAIVFTEEPKLTVDLLDVSFSSMQKKLTPEIKNIFNELIELGRTITQSKDPEDIAAINALRYFVIGINGLITALRQSLAAKTPTKMDFDLVKQLAQVTTRAIKKVIEKHPTKVNRLLSAVRNLSDQDLQQLDIAEGPR